MGLVIAALLSCAAAQSALATPVEEARELVYRGDDLCLEGRYEEALHTYRLAAELVDAPTTRIEVAKTLFVLGRWLEAYDLASSIDVEPDPDEPTPFRTARARARDLRLQIDARIPTVRVTSSRAPLPTSTRVVLKRGDVDREGTIGTPIRVDPGTYALTVEDGSTSEPLEVTVREGEEKQVKVEASVLVEEHRRFSPIAAVALGVSGAGLLLGTIAGAVYLDARADLASRCELSVYACNGSQRDRVDSIGWAANSGFIVFGVAGSVGLVTALVDQKTSRSTLKPQASLHVSPSFVGVSGAF
ncbi:MAG: hypothetical protein U0414_16165 [Polyangiaceae bacterium]